MKHLNILVKALFLQIIVTLIVKFLYNFKIVKEFLGVNVTMPLWLLFAIIAVINGVIFGTVLLINNKDANKQG